VDGMVPRVIVV